MATAPIDVAIKVRGSRELEKLTSSMTKLDKEVIRINTKMPKASNNIRKVGAASATASKGVNKLGAALKGLAIGYAAFQGLKFTILKTSEL